MSTRPFSTSADVVVVGAGIVGAACAYYLACGGLQVCVLERGGIAAGASSAGEGNILVSDKIPGPELELAMPARRVWLELRQELPDDFELEQKGGIIVAENDEQLIALHAAAGRLQSAGVQTIALDPTSLRKEEPHLAKDVAGGILFPEDMQVQPMLACSALLREARRRGATFQPYTSLVGVEKDAAGAIREVKTVEGSIVTPRLVNAAGPWSGEVARLAGSELPIQPRKGHIIVTEPLPKIVRHKVYEAGYVETVSSDDAAVQIAAVVEGTKSGTLLLGSSRQRVGFDSTVEKSVIRAIARRAVRFFPVLATVNALRAYVGFRPFAPDHLPVIGADGRVPGLYQIGGHEGAGIGLGPISAKLLSQMILGQAPELDMSPFDPGRFTGSG